MNTNVHGYKRVYNVSVGTVAKAINTNGKRLGLLIRNNDDENPIYLGGSDVTAATGFPLLYHEVFQDDDSWDSRYGVVDDWYAIAESTVDVRVIEYNNG